jgi:putative tryptophan/tyrosine transport system substrate-binding protein
MGRFAALLLVAVLTTGIWPRPGLATNRNEPVKIGALTDSWGPTPAMVGLRDGLKDLGYRDGEQFVLGVRFTQGNAKSLPSAARELIAAGSDILFASGTNAAKAAQAATTAIPIIFAEAVGDPVQLGLVPSFAKPGGNITGVTDLFQELIPKRLEIFKELLPALKRVVLPYDPADVHALETIRLTREAARQLGIALVERPLRTEAEARASLKSLRRRDADGIIAGGSMSHNIPGFVLEATSQQQIPSIMNGAFWAEQGALASYGADFYQSGRQAARLVDKIVKGEKPALIPVEANPKVELVINMKVAKALGLTLTPAVVQRATRLIE